MLTDAEVEALRQQLREAHEQAIADKPARDARLARARAERELFDEVRDTLDASVDPATELVMLLTDTWDVIEFLRSQMLNNARAQDGNDQSDTMREEYERVSTGSRPKSKPPMNVDALDAADAEMATLVAWAEYCGIPYTGQVWRVDGQPRGVLYGDTTPARSLAHNISQLILDGWNPPEGMVEAIRTVRFANLKAWPELDAYLTPATDEDETLDDSRPAETHQDTLL